MNTNTVIVIPTYNEIKNISRMINQIFALYPKIHLLIVDDNSPDKTSELVKQEMITKKNLHILERSEKLGLGSAYIEGFRWALKRDFEYIIEMDCDFSHDPKDIALLLKRIKSNDLVIGSRYIGGIRIINWPFKRLLLSFLASKYCRVITSMPIMDATGGFKCFSRKVLESIDFNNIISNGYSFQIEMNYKTWVKGFKVVEEPITFTERRDGESKMGGPIIIEAIFNVWRLRLANILGIL